jgi:hypothetical protein
MLQRPGVDVENIIQQLDLQGNAAERVRYIHKVVRTARGEV